MDLPVAGLPLGATMSKLNRKVELLHKSSERLMRGLSLPRDKNFWWYMRREAWLHLRRSWELLWLVLRKKE